VTSANMLPYFSISHSFNTRSIDAVAFGNVRVFWSSIAVFATATWSRFSCRRWIYLSYLTYLFFSQHYSWNYSSFFLPHIYDIVFVRSIEQMVRITTWRVVAFVAYMINWFLLIRQCEGDPMSAYAPYASFFLAIPTLRTLDLEDTIAESVMSGHPRPAVINIAFIDVLPKFINSFLSHWKNGFSFMLGQVSLLRRLMSQMASAEFAFGVDLL
jgi:hypothetical protein